VDKHWNILNLMKIWEQKKSKGNGGRGGKVRQREQEKMDKICPTLPPPLLFKNRTRDFCSEKKMKKWTTEQEFPEKFHPDSKALLLDFRTEQFFFHIHTYS